MPTYEYLCGNCGKFEELQSIKAPALAECPTCHGPVTRIISGGAGLIFKGSGFYLTDNRSPDYKSREKADKAPPPAPAGADTSAKPADSTNKTEKAPAPPPAEGRAGSRPSGADKPAESSAPPSAEGRPRSRPSGADMPAPAAESKPVKPSGADKPA